MSYPCRWKLFFKTIFFILIFHVSFFVYGNQPSFVLTPKKIILGSGDKSKTIDLVIKNNQKALIKRNFIRFIQRKDGSVIKRQFNSRELKILYNHLNFEEIFGRQGQRFLDRGKHTFKIKVKEPTKFKKVFPYVFQLGFVASFDTDIVKKKKNIVAGVRVVHQVERVVSLIHGDSKPSSKDFVIEKVRFVPRTQKCFSLDHNLFVRRLALKKRLSSCFNSILVKIRNKGSSIFLGSSYAKLLHKISNKPRAKEKYLYVYHKAHFYYGDMTSNYFLIYPRKSLELIIPLIGPYIQGKYDLSLYFRKKNSVFFEGKKTLTLSRGLRRTFDPPGRLIPKNLIEVDRSLCLRVDPKKSFPRSCPFSAVLRSSYVEDVFVKGVPQPSILWKNSLTILFPFIPDPKERKEFVFKGNLRLREREQGIMPHSLRFKINARQGLETRLLKIPIKLRGKLK